MLARILIVDDHPMVREGLSARIDNQPDMAVCGEAGSVEEALRLVAERNPDLVIVDLGLKDSHGTDLLRKIKQRFPETKTLVHSMYEDTLYAERALHAGAWGYVNKQAPCERVLEGIRAVLAGKTFLSPEMTDRILKSHVGGRDERGSSPVERLSNRELQVFQLLGEGLASSAIAERLHLSVHTVETYREKLKNKLNLKTGAELARYAVQWSLEQH